MLDRLICQTRIDYLRVWQKGLHSTQKTVHKFAIKWKKKCIRKINLLMWTLLQQIGKIKTWLLRDLRWEFRMKLRFAVRENKKKSNQFFQEKKNWFCLSWIFCILSNRSAPFTQKLARQIETSKRKIQWKYWQPNQKLKKKIIRTHIEFTYQWVFKSINFAINLFLIMIRKIPICNLFL